VNFPTIGLDPCSLFESLVIRITSYSVFEDIHIDCYPTIADMDMDITLFFTSQCTAYSSLLHAELAVARSLQINKNVYQHILVTNELEQYFLSVVPHSLHSQISLIFYTKHSLAFNL
jgi:hypothetical protein